MLLGCLATIKSMLYFNVSEGKRKEAKIYPPFICKWTLLSTCETTDCFRKEKRLCCHVIVMTPPLSRIVTDRFRNRVSTLGLPQLLFRNRGFALKRLHAAFWIPWSWEAFDPFSEIRVGYSKQLQSAFGKKEFVLLYYYRRFSEIRVRALVLLQLSFRNKDRPNKWLQSEPNTFASFFGSVSCRLNHTLCSLQLGLWKLNHSIVTV